MKQSGDYLPPIDNSDLNGQRADFERSIYERADAEDAERCPHGFPTGWDCCRHDPSLDDSQEDR